MVKHHAYHPLYTIIPHGKLIKVLFKIMKISFIGGDKQFTTVRKYLQVGLTMKNKDLW